MMSLLDWPDFVSDTSCEEARYGVHLIDGSVNQ